nr:phosphoribosylamine--glycine ligase [bacterium]
MKVLVVGGGGREHAIVWKLSQSPLIEALYCAPGNGGIASLATCVPIAATDLDGICGFVSENKMDFVVVAPDDPLAMGLVDRLMQMGVPAFGPTQAAARIEASKAFGKDVMQAAGIPTAAYRVFDKPEEALAYVSACPIPTVVKADGLALGKGVVICHTRQEARNAVIACMEQGTFGDSGKKVVIEECLTGPEMTVLAFSDGKTVLPMVSSQDHKRALDGDMGPNTGGMGTVSPALHETPDNMAFIRERVLQPCIDELARRGCPFKGVLYAGLMLTPDGVKVIEFNARFGDPEAQVVLARLETDLMEVFRACVDGTLDRMTLQWKKQTAVCVVMASGGYPGSYQKGLPIEGIAQAEQDGACVFHAGTRWEGDTLVTAGGRVLGVTALGADIAGARQAAYRAAGHIHFEGVYMRSDIAVR